MQSAKPRILFIEDEENLLNSMSFILDREGFVVAGATSGELGLARVRDFKPDLVLLDLNLPGMDGFEVAEALTAMGSDIYPAIIVITGRDDEDDIICGLERFADDYVVKPVQPRVLIARIQSVLRRTTQRAAPQVARNSAISIDLDAHVVTVDCESIKLTRTEFSILALLMRAPEKVLSRERIINAIRGIGCFVTERIVDYQVCRIRKKLGRHGNCIETVRGFGYKYRPDGG